MKNNLTNKFSHLKPATASGEMFAAAVEMKDCEDDPPVCEEVEDDEFIDREQLEEAGSILI